MKPSIYRVLKNCSNGFASFKKMTTMPIYDKKKTLKNIFLQKHIED